MTCNSWVIGCDEWVFSLSFSTNVSILTWYLPEESSLKKRRKHLEILFHTCKRRIMTWLMYRHDWYMVPEIQSVAGRNFLSFWDIFCPITPLTTQKIKILKYIIWRYHLKISFYTCILTITTHNVCFLRYGVRQTDFLSFWAIFCPFTPLATQKIKMLKKLKKHLEILSFYTSVVPKIMMIQCSVPEIWCVMDVMFIFHLGLFFTLLSH